VECEEARRISAGGVKRLVPLIKVDLGKWSQIQVEQIIRDGSAIRRLAGRIGFLSGNFLNVAYGESTLQGGVNVPETFVICLGRVDCFTFLDYVEAMRLSASFAEFTDNLRFVRYKSGRVTFEDRHHFFTDWSAYNREFVDDVTGLIGGVRGRSATKTLNLRGDGTLFLDGIKPCRRVIRFIPTELVDSEVLGELETGDYAGIYTPMAGLDVSHVGIVIKTDGGVFLRHASSSRGVRRVVDQDLLRYLRGKGGLLVLRPRAPTMRS
jgi:hypothetical protein